ncbi:hypothetical protein OHA72_55805 [Dactylosporangium sp. NBC_01737]|uniref:hypothetical protein n=1 Tax=Dactylosporangium sp. NBC_01737 TaxID=2975959 RepID=UPI002E1174AF|nr:hypothetical protein OHA72_55805 [Dactylosporangium sp. NBC_01737]
MRIALVTSGGFPEPHWHDSDLPLVAAQLRRLGAEVEAPAWDGDEAVRWDRFDALVVQSPWSMWRRLDAFPEWWTGQQRAVVEEAYAALCGLLPEAAPTPLSVRLDFIVDPAAARGLLLLEVEMVAPVKFFGLFPEQCARYAEAVVSRAS